MPLPLLLIGAAIGLGGYGVKKGFDAKKMNEKAEEIGRTAETNYENATQYLEAEKDKTNQILENLGRLKAEVFSNQIKYLVDAVRKNKSASSKLAGFKEGFSDVELVKLDNNIQTSLELSSGLGTGAISGALAAYGAYSGVGMLATASTGTAISTLSGAAATNATLAWLGGGSLATGGMGVAGGTMVLGGVVLGPALAIGGFMMASKAEEALTKAREYEAEIDIAIAKINSSITLLEAVQENAHQLTNAIIRMAEIFDSAKTSTFKKTLIAFNIVSGQEDFEKILAIGKSLKALLETPVMNEKGEAIPYLQKTISGYLEYKQ